jgi:hypothetical protein
MPDIRRTGRLVLHYIGSSLTNENGFNMHLKKRFTGFFILVLLTAMLSGFSVADKGEFVLVSEKEIANIYVHPDEPEYLHLAVADLISDVEKISGRLISRVSNIKSCNANCVVVGSLDNKSSAAIIDRLSRKESISIKGKWEAYHIKNYSADKAYLVIAGSDPRGAMFGIYHFIENFLGVDPLYFWSDREPVRQPELAWKEIQVTSKPPVFKYRGWFINDEDLLTEWMPSGGKRNIDYPYYQAVVNPRAMERVVEALVRSRLNLIIPASFIDIMNPSEEALVKVAVRRGVFISQHHVEPLGVSAFSFFNYWKKRGKEKLFSYYSSKDELVEVWEAYARKWATYPNVIWQIGLRGIADRPMWMADPGIPQSESDFGRIISEAMEEQMRIIKKYDSRNEVPCTTTLWAEGAGLFSDGHLKIPDECMIIFSDNSPGWIYSEAFYDVPREAEKKYGIYYHQQLWGSGPHLAPSVHPARTFRLVREAVEKQSHEYAIVNVSNIREFIFGIDATSKMLFDFHDFDLNAHVKGWFATRYPSAPAVAEQAYRDYYTVFIEHDNTGVPMLMDGQSRSAGISNLRKIQRYIEDREKYLEEERRTSAKTTVEQQWARKHLSAMAFPPLEPEAYHQKVMKQRRALARAIHSAETLLPLLSEDEYSFFSSDLQASVLMMSGLTKWLDHILRARKALEEDNTAYAAEHLEMALIAFDDVIDARFLRMRGKWKNWYRGDKKVNLRNAEKITTETIQILNVKLNPDEH